MVRTAEADPGAWTWNPRSVALTVTGMLAFRVSGTMRARLRRRASSCAGRDKIRVRSVRFVRPTGALASSLFPSLSFSMVVGFVTRRARLNRIAATCGVIVSAALAPDALAQATVVMPPATTVRTPAVPTRIRPPRSRAPHCLRMARWRRLPPRRPRRHRRVRGRRRLHPPQWPTHAPPVPQRVPRPFAPLAQPLRALPQQQARPRARPRVRRAGKPQ